MSAELENLQALLDERGDELAAALLALEPGERVGSDVIWFVVNPDTLGLELHDEELGAVYVLELGAGESLEGKA